MTHLKSMVDFVKMQSVNLPFVTRFANCDKYADFLMQKPELWMFVPCDENGNILEDQEWKKFEGNITDLGIILRKHKEAKEHCLFEGFETQFNSDLSTSIKGIVNLSFSKIDKSVHNYNINKNIFTVEYR